ncbi:MAG: YmdB family metallophosphoesterase [Rhodospirillaceae bacterium]|nr:YmdB family metallophosphoesterase [Rhodospirillaceae bacterium]
MKLLYCGDVMGRSGRDAITTHVPALRDKLNLDFVVVCGENAAHGFGITAAICEEFYQAGVDVITLGNHAWDQREIVDYIKQQPKLLRPLNFPPGTPGQGSGVFKTVKGQKVFVAQVICRLFMEQADDPFRAVQSVLATQSLRGTIDAGLLDIHGEATSEKAGLALLTDGRLSAAIGSHAHIPTADTRIMSGGTAFQTDAGMCGDFDSIIGMKKELAMHRFTNRVPGQRLEPAMGEATLCGVYVETNDATGLAVRAEPVRVGGVLKQSLPT